MFYNIGIELISKNFKINEYSYPYKIDKKIVKISIFDETGTFVPKISYETSPSW